MSRTAEFGQGVPPSHRSGLAARGMGGGYDPIFDTRTPTPRSRDDMHGHLINDHEHTGDGVGSSYGAPSMAEMRRIHDALHAENMTGSGQHEHPRKWKR